jgi:hypothetical protein
MSDGRPNPVRCAHGTPFPRRDGGASPDGGRTSSDRGVATVRAGSAAPDQAPPSLRGKGAGGLGRPPRVHLYQSPKRGSSDAEYEDAVAVDERTDFPRRFAVADGASESSFARRWAELLAAAYVGGGLAACSLTEDLIPLQERWTAEVGAKPLPWYAAEKARNGAFAALAGLTLHEDGAWEALAAGDCCVMHVREDRLLRSFPLADAAAFDNRPRLLSSNPERNGCLDGVVVTAAGVWKPGDSFLLLSDALAAYVLRRVLEDGRTVGRSLPLNRPDRFRRWAEERRSEQVLRNDDLSLVRVQVP